MLLARGTLAACAAATPKCSAARTFARLFSRRHVRRHRRRCNLCEHRRSSLCATAHLEAHLKPGGGPTKSENVGWFVYCCARPPPPSPLLRLCVQTQRWCGRTERWQRVRTQPPPPHVSSAKMPAAPLFRPQRRRQPACAAEPLKLRCLRAHSIGKPKAPNNRPLDFLQLALWLPLSVALICFRALNTCRRRRRHRRRVEETPSSS